MQGEDWDEDDGPTMDHRKAVEAQGALVYRRQAIALHDMDEAVIEDQPLLGLAMGYAMDAPETIPAGGMRFYKLRPLMLSVARD